MRFHIQVIPVADEPLVLTREQALDGLAWLKARLADGVLIDAAAFPQTGGYMIVKADSREALDDLLDTYPLIATVDLDINYLLPTLDDGFAVLLAAIDRRERIGAVRRLPEAEQAALADITEGLLRAQGRDPA